MNRREALAAAADLIGNALPAVVRREDGSWQHVVGVTLDGVPCLHIDCVAVGRTRDEERIARAAQARWAEWRTAASEVFGRGPEQWAEACERVAALEDPRRWMASGAEQRASDLSGLALPVTEAWYGGHWTAAWIGFGPVLDRVVRCDASIAGRIANAAAMVRASEHAAGRA